VFYFRKVCFVGFLALVAVALFAQERNGLRISSSLDDSALQAWSVGLRGHLSPWDIRAWMDADSSFQYRYDPMVTGKVPSLSLGLELPWFALGNGELAAPLHVGLTGTGAFSALIDTTGSSVEMDRPPWRSPVGSSTNTFGVGFSAGGIEAAASYLATIHGKRRLDMIGLVLPIFGLEGNMKMHAECQSVSIPGPLEDASDNPWFENTQEARWRIIPAILFDYAGPAVGVRAGAYSAFGPRRNPGYACFGIVDCNASSNHPGWTLGGMWVQKAFALDDEAQPGLRGVVGARATIAKVLPVWLKIETALGTEGASDAFFWVDTRGTVATSAGCLFGFGPIDIKTDASCTQSFYAPVQEVLTWDAPLWEYNASVRLAIQEWFMGVGLSLEGVNPLNEKTLAVFFGYDDASVSLTLKTKCKTNEKEPWTISPSCSFTVGKTLGIEAVMNMDQHFKLGGKASFWLWIGE